MRRGRQKPADERRMQRVEINLAADKESGGRPLRGSRRGCALLFGIMLLAFGAAIAAHTAAWVL